MSTATPGRSSTPRKPPRSTPRAASAPKARPDVGASLKKATAAATVSKALMSGAAPQSRGNPNNIKVGVRCRPLSKDEERLNEEVIVQFSGTDICLTNPSPAAGESADNIFAYDYLYQMDSESSTVFEEMGRPLVQGLLDGFNATLFAYGQTGSGKTFSMMGIPSAPGVIPLVAASVFEERSALLQSLSAGATIKVYASYLQIYREVLQDLLSGEASADLKIRRDPKLGTYVQGLSETVLEDSAGLTDIIDSGNRRRAVAKTNMNSESSRSHAVVIIRIEQEHPPAGGRGKKRIASKINLVDLAGSERSSKTGATGDVLKEAIAINQSLSALGNVINALTDPSSKGHIPYRSSKLTHLLEESLGGNSHTAMLAAISPAGRNFSETFQTLSYASRAKMIVTVAKANTFAEAVKGSAFGAQQAAEMQEKMAAEMQANMEAAQAAQSVQVEAQLAAMRAASSDELVRVQRELGEAKAALAAAQAVADMHTQQLENEKRRADEAERQRVAASEAASEAAEAARSHARNEAAEAARRAEAALATQSRDATRELEAIRLQMAAMGKERESALVDKERQAIDALEGQVQKAQLGEELRERDAALHAAEVRLASSDERLVGLERQIDVLRSQMRTIESQRDQAWAREKLLEEQRAAADAHARATAESHAQAQQQLQAALAAQVEMQRTASEQARGAEAAEVAGGLAEMQKALARLEARHEEQVEQAAEAASLRSRGQDSELARLDALLQTQAQQHAAAIEQLERRSAAEAERLSESGKRAAEQAAAQLAEVQARLREAQEARVRLQAETSTRKAAADALGERVAMLQDQLASQQLDSEQQRHAAIADKVELEDLLRARSEEVEAMRLAVLQHQHEGEGMRQQMRERDDSLARRAERLRQLQALYERALQDKQRVEEAAWAERQELHDERRALELRVREEAGRARQALESVERARTNPGLLERLFNQVSSPQPHSKERQALREAWAEQPAPAELTDSARVPLMGPTAVPNGGSSSGRQQAEPPS